MSVLDLIMRHNAYRNSVINMQASENMLSPNVKLAMSSDLGSRYSLEINGDNIYGGTRYMEEIYTETHENIKNCLNLNMPRPGHYQGTLLQKYPYFPF